MIHGVQSILSRRRSQRDDRGAEMVEAAFAMPIFVLVIFAIIEFSLAMTTYTGVGAAVHEGTRMASIQGNSSTADQQIMSRIASGSAGLTHDEIDYVIIWNATSTLATPPAACVPATYTTPNSSSVGVSDGGLDTVGACNVYIRPDAPGGAFDMANGKTGQPPSYYFGCNGTTNPQAGDGNRVDCMWPPVDRQADQGTPGAANANLQTDYVGIYIHAKHLFYTGMFGKSITVTDQSIAKIEPQSYAQ